MSNNLHDLPNDDKVHRELLTAGDGAPFELLNSQGHADIILVCEHASNRIPKKLQHLGLNDEQLSSHVAWDLGAFDLAHSLSSTLDAPLIAARFSRLVYDCNRPPEAKSSIPCNTEVCSILGNAHLTSDDKKFRAIEIYEPFHNAISNTIAVRRNRGLESVLVSIHSFTPVFNGESRSVEIGYLFGCNGQLANAMLMHSQGDQYDIQLNEPYGPSDGVLHTLDRHTEGGNGLHVMIEVRNDLLKEQKESRKIRDLIAQSLRSSLSQPRQ